MAHQEIVWFCITTLNDWFRKNSRHFLNLSQIRSKTKINRNLSRASCRLHTFPLSFDWFTGLSVSFVIGQNDYFGFGFTTLRRVEVLITIKSRTSKGEACLVRKYQSATSLPTLDQARPPPPPPPPPPPSPF